MVLVGLGNPGKKYEMTRHNMGYLVIQAFAHLFGFSLKEEKRFPANVAKGVIDGIQVHLVLPTTYMNESGVAVRKYLDYYNLPHESFVVVTDDVAIPFGELRLRSQGSSGGHNGLKSLERHLGTTAYPRLRMGIGRGMSQAAELSKFVLDRFNQEEFNLLPAFLDRGVQALRMLLRDSLENVMNVVNQKTNHSQSHENQKGSQS